ARPANGGAKTRVGSRVNLFSGLLFSPPDGDSYVAAGKGNGRRVLVNTPALEGKAPSRSFPQSTFDAAVPSLPARPAPPHGLQRRRRPRRGAAPPLRRGGPPGGAHRRAGGRAGRGRRAQPGQGAALPGGAEAPGGRAPRRGPRARRPPRRRGVGPGAVPGG